MAGGRAFLQQQAFKLVSRILQQVGRSEVARHQDGVIRKFALARLVARQHPQQPVGQILEVVQPLADIGVARLGEAGAVLVAHPVHGGLGGQAVAHRLLKRPVPAPVVGEHAVGLQHLERGAGQALAALQHGVEAGLQRREPQLQPRLLHRRIVGQQPFGRQRRLVQHHVAEGEPLGEPLALQPFGAMRRQLHVSEFVRAQQFAGGHGFGQHHGDGLDVLDLVLVVAALGAVLHHQHANRPTSPQQRRAEEGVIGVLARLGPIGEAGVRRRVRQADGLSQPRDFAHQAFARAQAGVVNGLGVQALGGEQLELARSPAQIDGADLGHHGAGDDPHHHVQPVLRRCRAGARPAQRLADLAQEVPWPPRHRSARRHPGSCSSGATVAPPLLVLDRFQAVGRM